MTEGTKSYLFGCHSFFFHPLFLLKAWYREYKSWPEWWQLVAIIFHDIGICGRQYLSDDKAKIGHWKRGAVLSYWIVFWISEKILHNPNYKSYYYASGAYCLVAGHCPDESGFYRSDLFWPDKKKWLIAPLWWMWCNYYIEKFEGFPPPYWKKLVAENLQKKTPSGNHQLYIKHKSKG